MNKTPSVLFDRAKFLNGTWDFMGYFPENCKDLPSCYTDKMTFQRVEPEKTQTSFMLYDTTASLNGTECKLQDKKKQPYGYTWMNSDKLQYGGGNNKEGPSFFFNMIGDEYELGITEHH